MNYYALSIKHYALSITHYALCFLLLTACNATKKADNGEAEGKAVEIEFNADSAYAFTAAQCDFGPRTMNCRRPQRLTMWVRPSLQHRSIQSRYLLRHLSMVVGRW